MARAIDADYLMERLNKKKAGPANKRYTEGFNDCLMRVRSMVHSMPTLTPPNEPLTLEQLREMDRGPVYSEKYKRWFLVTYFAVLNRSQLMDSTGTPFVADDCGPLYLCPPEGEADA